MRAVGHYYFPKKPKPRASDAICGTLGKLKPVKVTKTFKSISRTSASVKA